jgi:E3 ubiquitin-protein ligase RBX1
MSFMETDINAPPPPAPAGEGSSAAGPSSSRKLNKRFEIKKWNAVALWAWGTMRPPVDCRFFLCYYEMR